ncbi:LysR family transcriptional regulator [Parapusillimonas sp. JC17]|uniref:LysR family transcriptional regulator n=1 Tax=Parapusillimonas sp. JC17 TaxID=3445768 RepID=UPI003FA0FF16
MSESWKIQWDLNRLRIFVTVAKCGSLKGAAALLGMPQPAISRQIARLEAECKGRLFDRTGRGMTLTELGARSLPQIERVLGESEALTNQITATSGLPFGDVRIGVLPSLYMIFIVPLFFLLRKRFPGIRLQIFEGSAGQIDQWLLTGHIDIGLPYRYGAAVSGSECLISADSCLVGPAGDRLTRLSSVEFAQLDGLPLVLPSAPSGVRTTLDKLARKENVSLDIIVEADSTQLQKAIVAKGGAYTVLPRLAISAELESGQLQAARIVNPVIERKIVLATTSAHPPSYAARSVAMAIREIGELPETAVFWSSGVRPQPNTVGSDPVRGLTP